MQKRATKSGFLKSNLSFISQFLKNPKEIGAILPSSPLLGKAMAKFVPETANRYIVELGPGTGPITKALLKIGIKEKELFCLEQSERMVKHLKTRFPNLNAIQGDACELNSLLQDKSGKVNAIVSSLPLKSIPGSIVEEILEQMALCLQPGGIVIQFTYDLRKKRSPLLKKFKRIKSKVVIGNVPPARVDVFQKAE
jgi:phosphatidylethanolamine/phosphatidyl-N-methylethanolamine N-methyltransferase